MFLNKINVRIALTFTLFSTIVSIIIFSALSFLIIRLLKNEDIKEMSYQLQVMESKYIKGGLNLIIADIDISSMQHEGKSYFIRLQKGMYVFEAGPTSWKKNFEYSLLNNIQNGDLTILDSDNYSYNLDVLTLVTSDNTVLQTGMSNQYRTQFSRILKKVFVILLIPLVIISMLFGMYYASNILKPVLVLTKALKRIIKTGKKEKVISDYHEDNELSELVSLFNSLFEKNDNLINGMKETLDNVSHDLRTPLTRIRGTAEVAMQSDDIDVLKDAHSDCIEETETIIKMLNALLDITASENGVLKLDLKSFDLKTLFEKSVDMYNFVAEDKMIKLLLKYNFDRDIITADEVKFRQVIANLLDNAVKYSDKGGVINITVSSAKENLIIEIEDSGIGISEDEINNIWDRLYRSTRSRNEPGLGLGLSMVKAIITAHGGTVNVISELTKGSTFIVSIPLQISNY